MTRIGAMGSPARILPTAAWVGLFLGEMWAFASTADDIRWTWNSGLSIPETILRSLFLLAIPAALVLAVRWPRTLVSLFLCSIAVGAVLHSYYEPLICGIIALAATFVRGRVRLMVASAVGAIAMMACAIIFTSGTTGEVLWLELPLLGATAFVFWLVGVLYRRHHRAEERLQEAEAAALAAQERENHLVARELHDSVARELVMLRPHTHRLREARTDAERADELDAIDESVRRAQNALDSLVLVLEAREDRAPDAIGNATTPLGYGSVETEIAHSVGALSNLGYRMTTVIDAEVPPNLAPTIDRLLGEATANIIKHSGGPGQCSITLTATDHVLTLDIVSDVKRRVDPRRFPSTGTGLAGMTERVKSLGGSFYSRGEDDDTWHLHADLPLPLRRVVSTDELVKELGPIASSLTIDRQADSTPIAAMRGRARARRTDP